MSEPGFTGLRITGIICNDYRGSNHMGGLPELFKPV
jgi:hypothetical protein